jgi:serine phosphatase RsbU (regulator of sigma subunit)
MLGDLLFLYTDGIVEDISQFGEEFDLERLLQVLKENQTLPGAQIINEVILAMQRFSDVPAFRDDVTLTVVQRCPRPFGL